MIERPIVGEATTPDGIRVVISPTRGTITSWIRRPDQRSLALDRDGHDTITLPQDVQVAAGDLAGALS